MLIWILWLASTLVNSVMNPAFEPHSSCQTCCHLFLSQSWPNHLSFPICLFYIYFFLYSDWLRYCEVPVKNNSYVRDICSHYAYLLDLDLSLFLYRRCSNFIAQSTHMHQHYCPSTTFASSMNSHLMVCSVKTFECCKLFSRLSLSGIVVSHLTLSFSKYRMMIECPFFGWMSCQPTISLS